MKIKTFLLSILILLSAAVEAQTKKLAYFCGFENPADTTGWVFKKRGSVKSNFVIGNAVHRIGSKAMYVSVDNGASAGYESTASGYVIAAYRKFSLAAGTYDLSFDLRISGDANNINDVLMVSCFPTTKPDGSPQLPAVASMGQSFPNTAMLNKFSDNNGVSFFSERSWDNVTGQIAIPSDGDYWLIFYFKEAGGVNTAYNPGPCIDNIQFFSSRAASDCASAPTNVDAKVNKSHCTVSWDGNAPEYEILYFSSTNPDDTTFQIIKGVKGKFYDLDLNYMPEGCYTFLVRAVCQSDTSMWASVNNVLVYDPQKHCLDFLNFDAAGVTCTYGNFANPYLHGGVVDYGSDSKKSIHTIHFKGDEYDRLTGYELKTVPPGQIASVRLSNWTEGPPVGASPSGSITYTYTVQPDAKVLLLHYAAVLQYSTSHTRPEDQTRIHVEILGQDDKLLSTCTEADFNSIDIAQGNTRGWKTYKPKEGEVVNSNCDIKWLDWSVLGINLKDHVGTTVKIRLTMYACVADFHFAYAYFALDCSRGELEGQVCGEVPDSFAAPVGFDYKWYKMADAQQTSVCDKRVFTPDLNDTSSYYVDVMYPENNECKFTLAAYRIPRLPKTKATSKWAVEDCKSIVRFSHDTKVYRYPPKEPEQLTNENITGLLWDFGKYGTSSQNTPSLVIPNEGDTFDVVLRADFNGCYSYDTIHVEAPAVDGAASYTHAYICNGDKYTMNGKDYTESGHYTDTIPIPTSKCDSIVHLYLNVLTTDTVLSADTICQGEVIDFFGQKLTASGSYTHNVKSAVLDCDSLFCRFDLLVLDTIGVELGDLPKHICANDKKFELSYNITGVATSYSVRFDSEAFKPIVVENPTASGIIEIQLPDLVKPGHYTATLLFGNADCGNVEIPVNFSVLYASNIIVQRWNDVLGILNHENNGGYEFASFQWFVDDAPIDGATAPNLYVADSQLKFGSEYSVLLTRSDDNVSVATCPFVPTELSVSPDDMMVTFTGSSQPFEVRAEVNSLVQVYTPSGLLVSSYSVEPGVSTLIAPSIEGVYLMRFIGSDGSVRVSRIVVKP